MSSGKGKGSWLNSAGQGMLMGAQMGQNAVQDARAAKVSDFKMREYVQGQQAKAEAERARQAEAQQLAGIFSGQPDLSQMGPGGPTPDNAQRVIPDRAKQYLKAADFYAARGEAEKAAKYQAMSEEEFATTPQTVMRDGKPVNILVGKRGGVKEMTGYDPTPKFREVNTGGAVNIVNDYNLPASGQTFTKTVSPDTVYSGDITMRGQDMTNARARDANNIAATNTASGKVGELRKEFNALPQVKAYGEVQPVLQSAREAAGTDNAAADLNLIYAAAKIMDPTSVVRESETSMIVATGSPAQKYQGMFNHILGGGRLTAEMRKNLMREVESRGRGYEAGYQSARKAYEGIANKNNIPLDQVFIEPFASASQQPAARVPVRTGTDKKTGRKVIQYSDGTVAYQ
jgi:hypothetical protein